MGALHTDIFLRFNKKIVVFNQIKNIHFNNIVLSIKCIILLRKQEDLNKVQITSYHFLYSKCDKGTVALNSVTTPDIDTFTEM